MVGSVSALDWHVQKRIVLEDDFHFKVSYRFAYYVDNYYLGYARCRSNRCVVTFYKGSLLLEEDEFRCLWYHEIGHVKDYYNGGRGVLSEDYANSFMRSINSSCSDY